TQTVAGGGLRLQRAQAEDSRGRRVGRQLGNGVVGRDVSRTVVLLCQSRSPEAGLRRATDGKGRGDIVARRQLTDVGVAEVRIVLKPAGRFESQRLERRNRDVHICAIVLTVMRAGVLPSETRKALRALLITGSCISS